MHGDDLHRVVQATGLGPVDLFASSGGAVASLPWVLAHPDEVGTVMATRPRSPRFWRTAGCLDRVFDDIAATYRERGQGSAMAKFVQLVMHDGALSNDYLDRPAPDVTQFGFFGEDDGSGDDALLGHNLTVPAYHPDGEALRASGSADRCSRGRDEPRDDGPPRREALSVELRLPRREARFAALDGGFHAS